MNHDENLNIHIEICKRIFLRLLADDSWPWPDLSNSEDVVESVDNPKDP